VWATSSLVIQNFDHTGIRMLGGLKETRWCPCQPSTEKERVSPKYIQGIKFQVTRISSVHSSTLTQKIQFPLHAPITVEAMLPRVVLLLVPKHLWQVSLPQSLAALSTPSLQQKLYKSIVFSVAWINGYMVRLELGWTTLGFHEVSSAPSISKQVGHDSGRIIQLYGSHHTLRLWGAVYNFRIFYTRTVIKLQRELEWVATWVQHHIC
jgi:hypothetical protein